MRTIAYLALLIIVLAGGIVIGVKITAPIHARAIAAVRAERDAARRDADAFMVGLRSLCEGGQVTESRRGK